MSKASCSGFPSYVVVFLYTTFENTWTVTAAGADVAPGTPCPIRVPPCDCAAGATTSATKAARKASGTRREGVTDTGNCSLRTGDLRSPAILRRLDRNGQREVG